MKVGYLATTNTKGQIVIPKTLRDALAITPQTTLNIIPSSDGLYLYPVSEVQVPAETESALVSLLKTTQGAWGKLDIVSKKQTAAKRKLELTASTRRKSAW